MLISALVRGALTSAAITLFVWSGATYGYGRTVAGLVMGIAILWVGVAYFRSAGDVPPEEDPADVSASELRYVCTMCGLELKIEVATTDRAPTHCREPMVLVGATGRPKLRPVD